MITAKYNVSSQKPASTSEIGRLLPIKELLDVRAGREKCRRPLCRAKLARLPTAQYNQNNKTYQQNVPNIVKQGSHPISKEKVHFAICCDGDAGLLFRHIHRNSFFVACPVLGVSTFDAFRFGSKV